MNSRIILSTADFSANNIGRYVELSELTKKVLSKQTQYDLDSDEAIALNTFLVQLTAGGFLGGDSPLLKTLFIPALANSHDEMLYNIANLDGNGYPVNCMSEDEINAETKVYKLGEYHGKKAALCRIYTQGDPSIGYNDVRLIVNTNWATDTGIEYPSSSFVFYRIGALSMTTENETFINTSATLHFELYKANMKLIYGSSADKIVTALTQGNDIPFLGFNGISYVKNTGFEGTCDNVTFGETTLGDLTTNMTHATNAEVFNFGKTMYGTSLGLPLIAIGDYINPTQMGVLKGYVMTFLSALGITNS